MLVDQLPITVPEVESPFAVQINKLEVQPGQLVLVSVPHHYDQQSMYGLQQQIIKLLPDGCCVLVCYKEIAFHILGDPK